MKVSKTECIGTLIGEGVRVQAKLPSVKTRTFSSFYNPRNTLKKSAISCFLAFSFSLGIVAPAFAEVISIDRGAYVLDKKDDGNYYLRTQKSDPSKHFSTPFQIDDTKKKIHSSKESVKISETQVRRLENSSEISMRSILITISISIALTVAALSLPSVQISLIPMYMLIIRICC